jgi:branched-chain amino acid transport system permease protein
MRPMVQFLQLVVSGIAMGCVLGLIALGFTLIYKATETVNFAQGDLMMLGGFVALTAVALAGLPFWVGVIAAIAVMALFGAGLERLVLRPVLGQPAFAVVMVTIGVGFMLRGLASMVPGWGTETYTIRAPYSGEVLRLGGLALSAEQLAVILMTLVLCTALYLYFRFTRLGVAMQATSQNQLAAYYMGIPVARVNSLVWAISAGVAAFAGVLLAPITFVHVNMGLIGLKAFPAAVIGGFGSVPGAIAGGLVIGVVESLAGFYLPEGFKDVAAYIVVLLVLMVRPHGLFGGHVRKKV